MIEKTSIPCPQGIREEILKGQWLVEYYSEPRHPVLRGAWDYFLLAELHDQSYQRSGAGVICSRGSSLVQTLGFTAEEMDELVGKLEALTLPMKMSGGLVLDGAATIIRIRGGTGSLDLCSRGAEPEEWNPLLAWINDVWKRIKDKAFEESFGEGFDTRPDSAGPPSDDVLVVKSPDQSYVGSNPSPALPFNHA